LHSKEQNEKEEKRDQKQSKKRTAVRNAKDGLNNSIHRKTLKGLRGG